MADETPETLCDLDTSVPDWIIDHPETASLLREFGIDDSCGGKSLGYVCDQQAIDRNLVLKMLRRKLTTPATETRGATDALPECRGAAFGQVHRGRFVPADHPPEVLICRTRKTER